MPRVYRKKKINLGADRKCGVCGKKIEVGEEYLTWSFRYGGARYRCTAHPPRQSDLTQSKMSTVYAAMEAAEDGLASAETVNDVINLMQEVTDAVNEVAEEYRDAAEPFGGGGDNAERADELEGYASELDSFYPEAADDDASDEEKEEVLDRAREEAQDLLSSCPL